MGKIVDHMIPSQEEGEIDGRGLTLFPGLIDPHVHFRTTDLEYKEDWRHAARAAIAGGISNHFRYAQYLSLNLGRSRR